MEDDTNLLQQENERWHELITTGHWDTEIIVLPLIVKLLIVINVMIDGMTDNIENR